MNTNSLPTRADFLRSAAAELTSAGVTTVRLDLLVLLEDALAIDRSQLLAHDEEPLTQEQYEKLSVQVQQRARHIPLAYIRGKTEFYGRDFIVNNHVLEPRPESESIIDILKTLPVTAQTRVADIGSGSGALGITAALECGLERVYLHDIDPKTLDVARQNAKTYHVAAEFVQTDLLQTTAADYDILLCNLPYVPDSFQINTAAAHEPRIAIFGGADGLDLYRTMFGQISAADHKPDYIIAESMPPSHDVLTEIARNSHYEQVLNNYFIQLFRLETTS